MTTLVARAIATFILGPLLVCLLTPEASAQGTAGSVVGVVRDATDAVLPGVSVTIRHVDTATTYETVTNAQGALSFPVVSVGTYEFTAQLAGFKTATGRVTVELNSRSNLSIVLQIGEAAETVQVVGAQTAVETTSAQLADTFGAGEVVDLPIASGNVNALALLAPNTVDINTTGLSQGQLLNRVSSPVGGSIGSIGGNRARNNSFTVDGVDNNDPIGTGPQSAVIQDAVREFTVLRNAFSAEYGQSTGGQFNIVTKTGTNDVHGNTFWYHQNRALNAADILTQRAIAAGTLQGKPRYDFNRAGFTLGGPIARNRLFFFGAFEYREGRRRQHEQRRGVPDGRGLRPPCQPPSRADKAWDHGSREPVRPPTPPPVGPHGSAGQRAGHLVPAGARRPSPRRVGQSEHSLLHQEPAIPRQRRLEPGRERPSAGARELQRGPERRARGSAEGRTQCEPGCEQPARIASATSGRSVRALSTSCAGPTITRRPSIGWSIPPLKTCR